MNTEGEQTGIPLTPPQAKRPAAAERSRLVKKHPLAIRWFHWVNFPALLLMIWSGTLILWAYDRYPAEAFHVNVPDRISLYRWGAKVVYAEQNADNYPAPPEQRHDIHLGFRLAEGMAWHFTFAWLFTLNGIAYALYLWRSGEWRQLFPRRESLREAWKVALHDIGLYRHPLPDDGKYNHAQRVAYTGVLILGALMVITGLAIYKPAQLTWLTILLGGYQAARIEHFLITCLLVAFFAVHLAQVARAGWNNFRGMITGHALEPRRKNPPVADTSEASPSV